MLTIGQLARRVAMRTSTLRYYEAQGLLTPSGRSQAGYRLYQPSAEQTLRFIQRAQRLGFSLAEIGTFLQGIQANNLSNAAIIATAEGRYLALERQVTDLLALQHELQLFLQDMRHKAEHPSDTTGLFDQMLARVCANPVSQAKANTVLDLLLQYTGCALNSSAGQQALDHLRGQHVHVWQEDDAYHILIVSDDPKVAQALQTLAQLEAECHAHPVPQLTRNDEGHLFIARGDNAFIFARLFIALEQEQTTS